MIVEYALVLVTSVFIHFVTASAEYLLRANEENGGSGVSAI